MDVRSNFISTVLACTCVLLGCGSSQSGRDIDDITVDDAGRTPDSGALPPANDSGPAGGDAAVAGDGGAAPADATVATDGATPTGDAGQVSASGQWVLGYYAAYERGTMGADKIDWSGLTHVVFTRLKANNDGTLQTDFDVDTTNGPALARDIAQRAHQNGKKALLMLGGAGAGAGIRSAASNANRARFVAALLKAVKDYGYDGLDLDWEDDIDLDSFVALAADLRKSSAAPAGLILTVPALPQNPNLGAIDSRIKDLAASVDRYNLMTYWPATAVAGYGWLSWHNCPLLGYAAATPVTIEDQLRRHVMLGIPKQKLGMGVAFYAMCYTGGVTAPRQSTEGGVTIVSGDSGPGKFLLSELFAKSGDYKTAYKKWDDVAKNSYLTLPSANSRGCRYVSFEDEQSLEFKGQWSRQNGYGGVIIWTLAQGYLTNSDKAPNALTQAIKKGFLD